MVERDLVSAWTPVEQAYSLWLRTARERTGTAAGLARAVLKHLRKVHGLKPDADLSELGVEKKIDGAAIGRWEKGTGGKKLQPVYPDEQLVREALIVVVTDLVPAAPVETQWASFREVCEAFAAERLRRQYRGADVLDSHAARERNMERRQLLAAWPAPAGQLDPIDLGLGSWAFDGGLPPYVHRTVDAELARQLELPGITTVFGVPKSGKSRSVLEVLQRQYPDALIWWVNPSPTVLPLVLEKAKKAKENERPAFVVLDDAGMIGTNPVGGLTVPRLHNLAAVCTKLVMIVHDETFASWEQQLTHRTRNESDSLGYGATRGLIELIRNGVHYESVLDDEETTPAADAYEDADPRIKSFDLTRLAETFAGVEMLRDKARRMLKTPTSVEAALIEAAIDVAIVFPTGATPKTLSSLAREHYRRRQPNRPWRPSLLADAFDAVTAGITAGSPHAIIISTGSNKYRLLDALTPELLHKNRDPLSVLQSAIPEVLLNSNVENVVSWYVANDHDAQAERVWQLAANAGNPRAMFRMGCRALWEDARLAREWWERAANAGDAESMYHVAASAFREGDTVLAREWWERAANAGDAESMYILGGLTKASGHPESARSWWTHAADAGHTQAMYDLGQLANRKGDTELAREWWERAADTGDAQAMYNLGGIAKEEGDTEAAVAWWKRAADADHAAAAYVLGRMANRRGDEEAARAWFERAAPPSWSASGRIVEAVEILVELAENRGDDADARRWRERLAETEQVRKRLFAEREQVRTQRKTRIDKYLARFEWDARDWWEWEDARYQV